MMRGAIAGKLPEKILSGYRSDWSGIPSTLVPADPGLCCFSKGQFGVLRLPMRLQEVGGESVLVVSAEVLDDTIACVGSTRHSDTN